MRRVSHHLVKEKKEFTVISFLMAFPRMRGKRKCQKLMTVKARLESSRTLRSSGASFPRSSFHGGEAKSCSLILEVSREVQDFLNLEVLQLVGFPPCRPGTFQDSFRQHLWHPPRGEVLQESWKLEPLGIIW